MAVNVNAFFLKNPIGMASIGVGSPLGDQASMYPESGPAILWGQGTPDGDRAPFTLVNKGSLYISVNQTDDTHVLWQKVDEGGDDADWLLVSHSDVVSQWGGILDISNSAEEQVVFHAVAEILITEIGLLWNEATDSTVMTGDTTIGIATGTGEIVAATVYDISQSSGDYQALTIADGQVAAGESVFWSHDQAASSPGTCFLIVKYHLV